MSSIDKMRQEREKGRTNREAEITCLGRLSMFLLACDTRLNFPVNKLLKTYCISLGGLGKWMADYFVVILVSFFLCKYQLTEMTTLYFTSEHCFFDI